MNWHHNFEWRLNSLKTAFVASLLVGDSRTRFIYKMLYTLSKLSHFWIPIIPSWFNKTIFRVNQDMSQISPDNTNLFISLCRFCKIFFGSINQFCKSVSVIQIYLWFQVDSVKHYFESITVIELDNAWQAVVFLTNDYSFYDNVDDGRIDVSNIVTKLTQKCFCIVIYHATILTSSKCSSIIL